MSLPFGVDWNVLIGGIILIGITLIGGILQLVSWTGGVKQWIKCIGDWKNSVDNRFDKLEESIKMLRDDVTTIKPSSRGFGISYGMVQRHSPLVPSKQAIEILEELNNQFRR